jgi:hypothetical protein
MEWHAELPVDEPPGHDTLGAAWAGAMEFASGSCADLRRARTACARLLLPAERTHQDELPLVPAQVPALVAEYAALIADAGSRAETRDLAGWWTC